MHGVFGEVDFNLKVPGIQAEWQGPAVGDCDCYEATITPPDGKVARPVESDRVSKLSKRFNKKNTLLSNKYKVIVLVPSLYLILITSLQKYLAN